MSLLLQPLQRTTILTTTIKWLTANYLLQQTVRLGRLSSFWTKPQRGHNFSKVSQVELKPDHLNPEAVTWSWVSLNCNFLKASLVTILKEHPSPVRTDLQLRNERAYKVLWVYFLVLQIEWRPRVNSVRSQESTHGFWISFLQTPFL